MVPAITVMCMSSVLWRNNQITDVLTSIERERPSSASGIRTSEACFIASGLRTSEVCLVSSSLRTSEACFVASAC